MPAVIFRFSGRSGAGLSEEERAMVQRFEPGMPGTRPTLSHLSARALTKVVHIRARAHQRVAMPRDPIC